MPRRPTTKASRALGASAVPTPVQSHLATPLSSAYPSTYASEAEWDGDDVSKMIPIGALTLRDSGEEPPKPPAKKEPFRFLDLPSELRIKIYDYHFAGVDQVVDLEPTNWKKIHKRLAILRTCRAIYYEASHFFYSTHTFRIFPTHPGKFSKGKKTLLGKLNARQRSWITSLELRLGPGWNKPPRSWVVNPSLGLADCVNVRYLTVFVECDPSDGVFNGFRRADGFYEGFSRNLLSDVLGQMPFLDRVYFDGWSSVKKSGAMMRGLFEVTKKHGRKICWGPERGWTDAEDKPEDKPEVIPNVFLDAQSMTATTLLNGIGMNVVVVA